MKKVVSLLLMLLLLAGCAMAEELPQLVKVDFPAIDYAAPEKPPRTMPLPKPISARTA